MDRAYWDSVADRFDDEVLKILDRDQSGILTGCITKVAKNTKSVIDFGCGNGSLLPLLSQHFESVHAIDHSARLLEQAKLNEASQNVRFEQADLSVPYQAHPKADVLTCVNVLLHPDVAIRRQILTNAVASLKRGGRLIVVVPAFESLLHTYRTIVESNVSQGLDRDKAVTEVEAVYEDEVVSAVDGIVTLGTEPTKMHMRDEIVTELQQVGITQVRTDRIEFGWSEMIDDAPANLSSPYPWDWLLTGSKS